MSSRSNCSSFAKISQVDQPGTYWYHSHIDGQYPDGLRGPLIVHDPDSPYKGQYDEELVLTLSDWYHLEMQHIIPKFITVTNPTGAEPVPQAALMNDTQNLQIKIEPGKTYFLRLINIGAFAGQYFWIEGHTFRVVEVDGVWHEAAETDMIYITAAQRYGLLLTTKNETDVNYAIIGAMDQDLFDTVPADLNPNVTSYLVYDSTVKMPTPALIDEYAPFDDIELVPIDGEKLFTDPDQSVVLAVMMDNLGNGANYAFFNNITYVRPAVPSIYTALTADDLATNSQVYGSHTNAFVLDYQQVIEIVVNNHDAGKHPFHLHGHNFQAIVRGDDDSGDYVPWNATLPDVPMRRDTFMVRPNGHIVMRFRSDNPGVWLFHCHIEWHVDQGLIATIVEVCINTPMTAQKLIKMIGSSRDAADSNHSCRPLCGLRCCEPSSPNCWQRGRKYSRTARLDRPTFATWTAASWLHTKRHRSISVLVHCRLPRHGCRHVVWHGRAG
jgi:iron transport multicopper oxidase